MCVCVFPLRNAPVYLYTVVSVCVYMCTYAGEVQACWDGGDLCSSWKETLIGAEVSMSACDFYSIKEFDARFSRPVRPL